MNREQLAHVLRAAARIAKDGDILVIGSQSILGTYSERDLPLEATRSMEADVAFFHDDDADKADQVDGSIGDGSQFHKEHGFYGQGVELRTAVLPAGWQARVVPYGREDAQPGRAVCLEPHDLVISKLVAGRVKDIEFATALIRAGLVDVETLVERAEALETPGALTARVLRTIERCARIALQREL